MTPEMYQCAELFPLGATYATRRASEELSPAEIQVGLARHASGDWGDVCDEDRQANKEALTTGGRLFSVYYGSKRRRFWIITEADRSSTTVLLPEEY